MPTSSSDNDSPPPTADDFMDSSALAVSPILTSSILDEIYIQPAALDADTLAIGDSHAAPDLSSSRPRHHRRSHLAERDTSFVPPPPSARWRRRLARVVRSVATSDPVNESNNHDDDDYEDNSSGDENDYNHIGPVIPNNGQGFPRSASSHFIYGQNCLNDRAVNTSPLCNTYGENHSNMLDFDVVFDDGGQYGAMYGIENLLVNDGSVYCSGRKGAVNILTQYCGYIESGLIPDTSCTISTMVVKAPQHGFTAPCKDGLIFISNKEIDVSATSIFDDFTKEKYDYYVSEKIKRNGILDDTDPVSWFTLKGDRLQTIDLSNRAGKYVLIKLLRSDFESDNIDMQYIGFIGYSGARSFGCAKLC